MSAALALQQAVVAALSADSGVTALIGARCFDEAPRDAAFPYLTFGEATETDWGTKTDSGASLVFTLQAWSRALGFQEIKVIAETVRACLDRAPLTLAGVTLVDLAFQSCAFTRERDGVTRKAAIKFRALIES